MSQNAKYTIGKYDYNYFANEILRAISELEMRPSKISTLLVRKEIDSGMGNSSLLGGTISYEKYFLTIPINDNLFLSSYYSFVEIC